MAAKSWMQTADRSRWSAIGPISTGGEIWADDVDEDDVSSLSTF